MRKFRPGITLLASVLSFSFVFNAYAVDALDRIGGLKNIGGGQAEFKNSNRQNRLLIEVNMLSGVQSKGIHQVPDTTNLVDMVSLAGGPESNADLSEVHIKRRTKNGFATLEYDLESLVQSKSAAFPPLEDGDVVMIERSSAEKLYSALGIFGLSLGIIISGFVIRRELKNK